jgi:predicted dehydrogenase
MANTASECDRMNAAAAGAGKVLAVGMIRRFFPAFAQLRRLLAEGALGSLQAFDYQEGHKFEWEVTTAAGFQPRRLGGTGVLFDIGPHVLDHLAWTFGPLRVREYSDDALAGVESNASMEVTSDRCPGGIRLSWDTPLSNELRVRGVGGEAVLRIDRFDQLAVRTGAGFVPQAVTVSFPADGNTAATSRLTPRSYPQAVYCQLVQVVRAITLGEPPAVDGSSGAQTVAALESALAIAQPLDMPWLGAEERAAFARLHWRAGS